MTLPAAPVRLPAVQVDPPPIQPYGYGLLAAASLIPATDRRWEGSGVVYANDGCAPGGGIWPNPCEEPPAPGATATAFTLTITPGAGTTVTVALTDQDEANYWRLPVRVSVATATGTASLELVGVGASQVVDLGAAGTYDVTALVGPGGYGPECGQDGQITLPATDPVTLTCTAPLGGWPVKRIPMGQDWTEGRAFIVYEAAGCLPAGWDDAAGQAQRLLALHEQFWVEQRFFDTALSGPQVATPWAARHPLPLRLAVGLLEQEVAARYGGIGTLHARRTLTAELMKGMEISRSGNVYTSPLDNRWAFAAGYRNTGPDGTPAPDGQTWLYATGPVTARRSEVQVRESFNYVRNERWAIAERAYVLTADCLRLAVLAQLTGAT